MLAVVVVAVVLRAVSITAAAPYSNYIDEPFVLERSAHMIDERTVDPGWYRYPPLLAETTAVVAVTWDVLGGPEVEPGARQTVASPSFTLIEPFSMVVAARLIVLAAGVGTVLLTIALGARLLGGWLGLAAGLLAAVVPMLVTRSAIVIIDTPATFFVMAALVAASLMATSRRAWRWAALAGAASGLAFTSKYPAGAVVIAVLIVAGLTPGWSGSKRLRLAAIQLGAMTGAAIVSMPVLVTKLGPIRDDIDTQAEIYENKSGPSFLEQLRLPHEVGTLLLVVAVVGVLVLLARRQTRRFTSAWLVFALVSLAFYSRYPAQPVRNLLPLVPFLMITAVAALDGVARLVGPRVALPRRHATALVVVVVVGWAAWIAIDQTWPAQDRRVGMLGHRVEARQWLQARTDPGDRILVAEELGFLPSELRRLDGDVVVTPFLPRGYSPPAVASVDTSDVDYVVTAGFVPGGRPGWKPPPALQPALSLPGRAVPALPSWNRNTDYIVIYEL